MSANTHSAATLQPGALVSEREAAAILGIGVRTLRNWRPLGKGPKYRKIGERLVRYHVADLEAFQRVMAGESGEAAR